MINFFTIVPLIFLLISSYVFNKKKLKDDFEGRIILISFFEGIFSFVIVYLLTLKGSISIFGYFFLLIFLCLLIGYLLFFLQADLDSDWDLQLETVKNNIILYATTLLPIYVFLTIFRFLNIYLQISLTLLITAAIFISSLYVKKWLASFFEKLFIFISDLFTPLNFTKIILFFVFIWVVFGVFFAFDLPTNKISQQLNLSNHVGYFNFDEYPTNLKDNFQTETDVQIISSHLVKSEENIHNQITDYYYDKTNLYLYTTEGELMIYNINTKDLIYDKDLNSIIHSGKSDRIEAYNKFIFYNNHLLLLGTNGIYIITTTSATKISDLSCYTAYEFYHNNDLYFFNKHNKNIYKFDNDTITLSQSNNNKDLLVISKNLFYIDNNKYILMYNPNVSFNILQGYPIYNASTKVMYFAYNQDYSYWKDELTFYRKEDKAGNISKIKVGKHHNPEGIIAGDYIYYTEEPDDNAMRRVEIIDNNNFKIYSISNFQPLQAFWIGNKYTSYIANYSVNDNQLEYLQIDQNNHQIVITIHHLQQTKVDFNLPFYTHYGLGIFIIIILAYFIPTTNYREYITIIDFDSAIKSKIQ